MICNNRWLFGTQYGQIIQKEKVGFDNIPDFLLLTADGFLDVLEIKKPSSPVLVKDSSHKGNYKWSSEVTEAIAQADNYLNHTNSNHLAISQRIREKYNLEINAIKPRAIILIGKSDKWDNKKRERFRSLNQLLHGVEVVTYTDLLRRGQNLIKLYTE
ncbi:Shedu immune nuclease family protein [Planktothrix sp.]|uniref:Shedu immune nuclease family protein n=1 Tax=Planktothrix sp. TaxID=3088171 RepID=UPI0038D37CA5